MVEVLLKHSETKVNQARTIDGSTPLMIAAKKAKDGPHGEKYMEVVKLLLRCPKVDIKVKDRNSKTVMEYATRIENLTDSKSNVTELIKSAFVSRHTLATLLELGDTCPW